MSLAPGLDREQGVETTPVRRNARRMLRGEGVTVTEVVHVNPDSVLFLGCQGRPMTGWMSYAGGRLAVVCESGFVAEPSAWVQRRLDRLHHPEA